MPSNTDIQAIVLSDYLELAPIVILYYDHLITLSTEISHMWSCPSSKPSMLFFVHRYVPFIGHIAVLIYALGNLVPGEKSCQAYILFHQFLLAFNQAMVAVLLVLRTYAFLEKSRRVLAVLCLLFVVAVLLACWNALTQHSLIISGARVHGRHSSLSFDTGVHLAIPWEAQILFDMTVFGLTLVQSYKHRENLRWFRGLEMERSGTLGLVELLFRDGAIYFGVMALVNLENVLTFHLTSDPLRGSLSTFASCVSITMMSRLVLNLRDASSLTPSQQTTTPSMTFASIRNARKSSLDGTEMLPSNRSDAEHQDSAARAIELSRIERP